MKARLKLPDLIILITVASTTLYIVVRNLPLGMGSFAYAWAPITLFLILNLRPYSILRGAMKPLLFYGIIMVGILQYTLWAFMNDWNQRGIFFEFYYLVVMLTILNYYLGRRDLRRLALISKWAFIFIIISLIGTNIALFVDSTLVRESARTGVFSEAQATLYKYSGAMGYSYVQAIIFLIPILIYHIKERKRMIFSPNILLVILLLILITQIRAQVFANMLVTVLITSLSLLGSKNQRISFVTITIVGILLVAIPNSYFANFVETISSNFNKNSTTYYKLNDFAVFLNDPELDTSTGAGARAARYPLLFDSLIEDPITGNASDKNSVDISGGAHLFWMNRLALWGIPGFLFFIFIFFKIFKSISSLFDKDFRFYYFISVLALIFLGLTKVVGGAEPWLMLIVVIPGLYFLPLLQWGIKKA